MQRLVVDLAEALRHRLDRLTPSLEHQPAQVAGAAGSLVLTRQGLEHLVRERLQASADSGQLACCDASHSSLLVDRRAHPPTSSLRRKPDRALLTAREVSTITRNQTKKHQPELDRRENGGVRERRVSWVVDHGRSYWATIRGQT
jgi:hypothetical protein